MNLIFKNNLIKNFSQGINQILSSRNVILMMGAPGVGKGTFSKLLSKDYKIPEFSTGDELRKIINSNDKDNENENENQAVKNIKQIVREGKLVDDNTMLKLVQTRLSQSDTEKGIILDGYPRTLNQAKQFGQVSLVLDIFMDDNILIPKMLARRICKCCGNNYNIYSHKDNGYDLDPLLPKKNINKCDDCDIELSTREDDKENIIRDRLKIYKEHTLPIMEFYDKQNILIRFEPKKGKKDYPVLKSLLDKFIEGIKISKENNKI